MKWFKKWLQERNANRSNSDSIQNGNKSKNSTSSEQSVDDTGVKLSRESICKSSEKTVRPSSSDCPSSSSSAATKTGPISVQSTIHPSSQTSIHSTPIARRIRQQVKSLESLISDSVTSDHSINVEHDECEHGATGSAPEVVDPDDFFENPDDIRKYKEKNAFIDEYIIIDIKEVETIRRLAPPPLITTKSPDKKPKRIKYQTTEFSIKLKPQPKKSFSMSSYCNDGYGLFYGTPSFSLSQFPETFCYRTFPENLPYKDRRKRQYSSGRDEPPSSSRKLNSSAEIIEQKVDAFEKSLMGPLITELPKPCTKTTDKFSIQKTFGLTDDGDIIVNIDHVVEEKAEGFWLSRRICIYRSIDRGDAICEEYRMRRSLLAILKEFFKRLCHPRNKQNNSGPGESVAAYALTLAADTSSTFSRNIENFIACTKESREVAPQVVMRNMRQFMSGMKNYLVKHGEGNFQQEVFRARSLLKADEFLNLDTILEGVMHQLVVLPLREYLYGLFVDFYTGTSDIQLLVENVKYASARSAADFGIRSTVTPPSSAAMQQISLLILRLQEAELPLEKLEYLLAVVSAIFEASKHPRGQPLGADDFLPILVFIVAKCGFIGAEIEAEFMWCLLQQSLLNGEAGYYLTALCSAVHVLKTFMASEMDGTGSLDIRSSSQPACSSVLRVIIPDEYNGSLQTRTLPVRPHTTTREVCRTIAHKARITNPQDYGLFKLVDGEETLLMDNDCPQEARLAARGKHCMLAYKRIDAKIAWPTMTSN
ncbi:uncharacterized protein LOC119074555 isoform X6 [Bradysia coprophila]|uniref:uncharacterized protein LOC119074555 isoform X6 n=1 Tax=Bradysia coprophila TaxID=38358 RepID=UPI00187DC5CD|nr:uncharacterized protein LOC119074555 isoform X6 [Bradysia coprophila]